MAVHKDRIGLLEVRISELETWAGPGQAEAVATGLRAVRGELAVMRRVQNQHTAMLHGLTADVTGIKGDVAVLQSDVTGIKGDVAELRADVAGLKADVGVLKADVAELRADVAVLKSDVAELRAGFADMKMMLSEILRRLPPLAPTALS
jgi:chromosome segregation ATPase